MHNSAVGLAAIPSLDEIAAHPDRAAQIPAPVAQALMSACVVALAALNGRLLAAPTSNDNGPPEGDRRLSVQDAAARLGVSKDWLYRHADALPFTVRMGRTLGFSQAGVDRYLKQRAGR